MDDQSIKQGNPPTPALPHLVVQVDGDDYAEFTVDVGDDVRRRFFQHLVVQALSERQKMGKDKDHPPAIILFDSCDPRKGEAAFAVTCWESFEQAAATLGAMGKYERRGFERMRRDVAGMGSAIVVLVKTPAGSSIDFVEVDEWS
jgi:hypothetical protein